MKTIIEDLVKYIYIFKKGTYLQVFVTRHEEEVVVNKLLADLLLHTGQGVVGTGQVTLQVCKCLLHQVLNTNSLVPE